jgi:hypothetical protein
MAGTHQIWKLDLTNNEVSTFAGSGREARQDGPLLDAGFAQSSGITSDGKKLYIADSESNIIRAIDIAAGQVETLVGGDLFEFGDIEGSGDDVRLQHPLGVTMLNDKVLIADTYNHKIKSLDPKERAVRTLLGTGKPGQTDGAAPAFYEPGGLSIADNKLYIADTNNHAVRVVDLATKQTSTLNLKGLQPPVTSAPAANSENESGPNVEEIKVGTQRVSENANGDLVINVELPAGYHLNPAAPQRYRVHLEDGPRHFGFWSPTETGAVGHDISIAKTVKDLKLPLRIPFQAFTAGTATVSVQLTLFYCREDNTGVCRIKTLSWQIPVEVSNAADTAKEIVIQGKLTAD